MERDRITLLDIARAAQLIQEFVKEMPKEAFLCDLKTQSAALHQLMVIGEAVRRLSAEFRAENSAVPWTLMAGMRDKLIHGYDVVDLEEVWRTVEVDIPVLLQTIQPQLPQRD